MVIQIDTGGAADPSPIIGIDLGTTNSLVAHVRDGVPRVLDTREGRHLLPSVVSFDPRGGSPVIGYRARDRKVRDAEHTVFSVKRLLGRGFEDLAQVAGNLPYRMIPGEGTARIQIGERAYTPIEISAMILGELRLGAESALGMPVTRAVITVPAYFNDSQRQATRAAGRLAGLDVLRIINEPTAASLAYGLDRKRQGLIAVYDLGGGTFDISILRLHDGIFEVLATHGDTALGGDDLDQVIARQALEEIRKESPGVDPWADPSTRASLIEAAEATKIALSDAERAVFRLDLPGGLRFEREWSRGEFENRVRPVLERTREPCLQALKDAGLGSDQISDVVMVGGPTRLAIVQEVARQIFGRDPNTSVHPDEVVAVGAAIQADILAGRNREFLLLDVVPLTLGLETYGGLMAPLIARNTRIPVVARETFTTFVDNQTAVDIHVLQGERERVRDNRSLARFKLRGLSPAPAGAPRVEVSFLVDADGILQVSARDTRSGHEQSIEVRPSYGLSEAEVERMLRESSENAEADIEYRALVEARNGAESVLRAAEGRLPDAARLLPPFEARLIRDRIEDLRKALKQPDCQKIRQCSHLLDQATQRLADLILKEALVPDKGA